MSAYHAAGHRSQTAIALLLRTAPDDAETPPEHLRQSICRSRACKARRRDGKTMATGPATVLFAAPQPERPLAPRAVDPVSPPPS
jgi:hypothetical protein